MEFIVIEIIKVCLIGWLIVELPVFQLIIELIKDFIKPKDFWSKIFFDLFLMKVVSCYKCSAFWSGLLLTGNIWIAIGASFIMKLYDQKLNSLEL